MIGDVFTVFTAELARRITSRPFIVSVLIGALGIVFLIRSPDLVAKAYTSTNRIVIAGNPSIVSRATPLLARDFRIVATLPVQKIDETVLRAHHADAAVVVDASADGLHVTVYTHDPGSIGQDQIGHALLPLQLALTTHRSASEVRDMTTIHIDVKAVASKFSSEDQALAVRGVAYTMIFGLYLLIMINSQLVMSSVAEEKTSRIAELLIASVNPIALLSGKILASATLGFVQLGVWAAAAILFGNPGASPSGNASATGVGQIVPLANIFDVITPSLVLAFLVYFIIGFLQLALLFAGGASLINRTEDLGTIAMPLVFPLVGALIVAIIALGAPNSPLPVVMSFIPILAPFVMFARIAVSDVPIWQIALSLGINAAAVYLIAILVGKVYRVGMLLYGRSPSPAQVWSVIRS